MKRKWLMVMGMVLLSIPISTFAAMEVKLWGGYTTVSMEKVNKLLKDANFEAMGLETKRTLFGSGVHFGADFTFEVVKNLFVGPRVGFLYCFPAAINASSEGSSISIKLDGIFHANLLSLLIGGFYSFDITEHISLRPGIYLGYGIANVNDKVSYTVDSTEEAFSKGWYSGGGFVADIPLEIVFKLGNTILLGADVGYRYAHIPEVKMTKKEEKDLESDYNPGDTFKDSDGKPLPFDYSGFSLALKLGFRF